jgi:hypothetical protein
MASLGPLLIDRTAVLEGVRRLRIVVSFVAGEQQSADLVFVEPASQARRVQAALVQQLCRMRWPSEVEMVQWTLLECGELTAPQLTLFAQPGQRLRSLNDLADKLSSRYSPLLFQANLLHATHPVPERRSVLQPLAQALTGTAAAHVSSLA